MRPPNSLKKHEILVVDDDEVIGLSLSMLLDFEGYAVRVARNGRLALDHLLSSPTLPSLILLDLMMPVMDGFQFRAEQIQNARLASIPVVLMTADGNVEERKHSLKVDDFLKKPAELETILVMVRRFCLG